MRNKRYNGIPENILEDVMKIVENENYSDGIKAAKLHQMSTCFIHKSMISQLIKRSKGFVQTNLKGVF